MTTIIQGKSDVQSEVCPQTEADRQAAPPVDDSCPSHHGHLSLYLVSRCCTEYQCCFVIARFYKFFAGKLSDESNQNIVCLENIFSNYWLSVSVFSN